MCSRSPEGSAEKLLWMVGAGAPARPWLPLVGERDERWEMVFAEQVERMRIAADTQEHEPDDDRDTGDRRHRRRSTRSFVSVSPTSDQ